MKILYGILVLLVSAIYVLAQVGGMENAGAIASSLYGVLITLFLLVLVWGFSKTHISYLAQIEDAKRQVLEVEGLLPCKDEKTL